MKAWLVDGDFGLGSLRMGERPTPQPGRGEVLVRIRAVSLNYRDLLLVEGQYDPSHPRPFVPVSDGAGEVAAVGEGVARVRIGDRVAGAFARQWIGGRPTMLGATLSGPPNGALSEYALLDEEGVFRFPEHLSFEEASTLPIAALTAWHALFVDPALRPGDTVLVQGTGGVAVFAIQFARAAGARVIVISSSDEKIKRAKEIGAHDGINYNETPAWDARALALTDGVGVDLVIDVAGTTLVRSVNALRTGGQVNVVGLLAGAKTEIDLGVVLQKKARIQGVNLRSRAWFEDMSRAIVRHRLRPVIDRVYPFEMGAEAIASLRGGSYVGKLVIQGA